MAQNNIYLTFTLKELNSAKIFLEKQFGDSTNEVEKRELFEKLRQIKSAIKILTK